MLGVGDFGKPVGVPVLVGAMVTSFAVIAIANMGEKPLLPNLILPEWLSVSMFCFFQFVIYITNDKNAATEVMKWIREGLAGASWSREKNASRYIDLCKLFSGRNIVI